MHKDDAKPEDDGGSGGGAGELPPMVCFVAPSGTGKTTLLELVVAEMSARGHRVGAVKHDAHRIELDTEGKDSWRLRAAGAASTALMGRNQLAWFGADDAGPSLRQVAALFFSDVDIILIEGFRSADLPVIMVERPDHHDDRWEAPDPKRVLLTVAPDEVSRVVEELERHLGR